jgi:hypothetical protein
LSGKRKAAGKAKGEDESSPVKKAATKKKAPVEKAVLPRTPTPARGAPPGTPFTALSWNVNSLRTTVLCPLACPLECTATAPRCRCAALYAARRCGLLRPTRVAWAGLRWAVRFLRLPDPRCCAIHFLLVQVKNTPELLTGLVQKYQPDLLCLHVRPRSAWWSRSFTHFREPRWRNRCHLRSKRCSSTKESCSRLEAARPEPAADAAGA